MLSENPRPGFSAVFSELGCFKLKPACWVESAGRETRRPLGLAVGSGLLVSQIITRYLTPVV
jgi:multidrug efflux pump subunit AcrB